MFRGAFFFLIFGISSLFSSIPAYLCIDGCGVITKVSVLDQEGKFLDLEYGNVKGTSILFGSTNVHVIGKENMEAFVKELFGNVMVLSDHKKLQEIAPSLTVIGGLAGLVKESEIQSIEKLFISKGCDAKKIKVQGNGIISCAIAGAGGISLHVGMGSNCIAEEKGKQICAGGLGRLIDDRGGGYDIGILAIRACLEEAYGYGKKTILTDRLCKRFSLLNPVDFIALVHSGRLAPQEISSISEVVMNAAFMEEDEVAVQIVEESTQHLAKLVSSVYHRLEKPSGDLYIWGCQFHEQFSGQFLARILSHLDKGVSLAVRNDVKEYPSVLLAKKELASSSDKGLF